MPTSPRDTVDAKPASSVPTRRVKADDGDLAVVEFAGTLYELLKLCRRSQPGTVVDLCGATIASCDDDVGAVRSSRAATFVLRCAAAIVLQPILHSRFRSKAGSLNGRAAGAHSESIGRVLEALSLLSVRFCHVGLTSHGDVHNTVQHQAVLRHEFCCADRAASELAKLSAYRLRQGPGAAVSSHRRKC